MNPLPTSEIRRSVCALDCPDTCSILVTVENGRATKLRGNPDHPVTRGFLCPKVTKYLDRQYSPDRLLYPQRRAGRKGEGRFERISWDEALGAIADRLGAIAREHGSEAILPYSYAGNMGLLNAAGMDRRFFHRLGASRLDRTICAEAGTSALNATMGYRYGVDPEQFPEARLILAWGANILGANPHLWPFVAEARRRGARFYVIDPVPTRTARLADRHFPVNPGSDAALALGIAHVILRENLQDRDYIEQHTQGFPEFAALAGRYPPDRAAELTGIPAADIIALAREYATAKPAVIRLNYGVQRSERGGASVRAISALPALTGAWRQAGGGLLLTTSGCFRLNRPALERPDLQWHSPLGREARLINMTTIGQALTTLADPPVKALFVYNSNPVAIAPNQNLVIQGLSRPDLFTVVAEQFQTDTADFADILLPVTTFLENTDLYFSYGHYYLQYAEPALAPPGEARSNFEIFRLLAGRMGFQEICFRESEEQMVRDALASGHPFLQDVTLAELKGQRFARLNISAAGKPFLPFADGGFGTTSGKFEFQAGRLAYEPPVESRRGDRELASRYPLELISSKSNEGLNSTFGNRDDADRACQHILIHPDDAAARGITDEAPVRVYNQRGECVLTARLDGALRRGIGWTRAVRWRRRAADGVNVNVLTSDRLTDEGGGPTFYNCLVEIERCLDS